ncbi:AAA family ATPase [Peptostreptococcus equinus]|uniref:MoxR family ATPase n=1 Tax=Peptostreptococcus equinus TaxID=3003601 RepID=A0ABY7JRF9_9FIRM|nr:MoxR family ATPase [Peptostreptococcus sp. CBA3647]WAW14272.1 MoxR family ATPase [Peptostreptococcus sp. CBA3647]
MREFLESQEIDSKLIEEIYKFREYYKLDQELENRIANPKYNYYGKDVLNKSIAAILAGKHILLTGPKASGKNVLAENLSKMFSRPLWNISMNINTDSASLIGGDTFRNNEVVFSKGPIFRAAESGGFAIFDEINMAKNESLSVVYSALDHRREIDVPGYDKIHLHEATRFIGTMNYGYIGTKELNEALVSRFMVIDMPTISRENLEQILINQYSLTQEYRNLFIQLFMDLQKKSLNAEISSKAVDLRGMFSSIDLMNMGLNLKDALELGIINKTFDTFEKEIVSDVIDTLFEDKVEYNQIFK